jgi:hypothetical protein
MVTKITQSMIDDRQKNNLDKDGKCTLASKDDFGNCLTDADLKNLVGRSLGASNSNYVKPLIYEARRQDIITDADVKSAGYDPESPALTEKSAPKMTAGTKALVEGSWNDFQSSLNEEVQEKYPNSSSFGGNSLYIEDVLPETLPTAGSIIISNWDSDKYYKIPFTRDSDGEISLGDSVEVSPETNYNPIEATAKSFQGMWVEKDNVEQIVTAPVLTPGKPDCDHCRGEKILTTDEVKKMAHVYMATHRIVDKMHDYAFTEQNVGDVVESYLTDEPKVMKNIRSDDVELPTGTWMASVKVTDPDTWAKVEDGTYNGFSGTFIPEDLSNKLTAAAKEGVLIGTTSADKSRTLIADLDRPVGFTISLVPEPCVKDAVFCSIKDKPLEDKPAEKTVETPKQVESTKDSLFQHLKNRASKAGRTISDANYSKIKDAINLLTDFVKQGDDERTPTENDPLAPNVLGNEENSVGDSPINIKSNPSEVDDMNEQELADLVGKAFDDKIKPVTDKIDELEKSVKAGTPTSSEQEGSVGGADGRDSLIKCPGCDNDTNAGDQYCPQCGVKLASDKGKDKTETDEAGTPPGDQASVKSRLEIVEKMLKIPAKSKGLESAEPEGSEKTAPVDTYTALGRDAFGRKIKT